MKKRLIKVSIQKQITKYNHFLPKMDLNITHKVLLMRVFNISRQYTLNDLFQYDGTPYMNGEEERN
jgi:hypothetical protein